MPSRIMSTIPIFKRGQLTQGVPTDMALQTLTPVTSSKRSPPKKKKIKVKVKKKVKKKNN